METATPYRLAPNVPVLNPRSQSRLGGVEVRHILSDGVVETHDDALRRLLQALSLPEQDMFRSRAEVIEDAYLIRGRAIAYDRAASARAHADVPGGEER